MKILRHTLLPLIIFIILFTIPFFWLKPGEIDLGGDSSRLYFYDPITYLFKSAIYVISPSSFGFENLNYANFPFITLLVILKSIFTSTILASGVYGVSLGVAFIFCYLIILELINTEKGRYAAIVGALVYVLSPALIDGWKHVLITYNQIFLNPLIFYLLLKYFKTAKIYILFIVVFLTFIFSTNFSIGAAPAFFSFYPASILFLILYTKFILKRKIIIKHILLALFLFMGIQAFHIVPQIRDLIYKENVIGEAIFSDEAKFNRGLNYFSAIAPNIKASINLLGLPQMKDLSIFSKVFLVFPFIIITALLFNKNERSSSTLQNKTIILTVFFFLIILLFATANITNTWLSIYKFLFNIPGFSMFRNFYGQWQFTYIFFYSILFGQALYILLNKLRKMYAYLLTISLIPMLIIYAIPLIKGDFVREDLWQSNNIPSVIQMDPDYEKALSFIRSLPAEGRVLTLPLSDHGVQIVAGKSGGAYMGPSTIAYLGGKKDFAGYDELEGYKGLILRLARDNELETLKRILGILNIKYIFYNADPIIYDEFPNFPYQYVRFFLPQDQQAYKKFIQKLKLKEIKNINNKFFVFEMPEDYYLPQINVAQKSIYFNKSVTEMQAPLSLEEKNSRIALFNSVVTRESFTLEYPNVKLDEFLIDIRDNSSLLNLIISTDRSNFEFPFASWKMTSLVYPLVILREKKELAGYKVLDQIHIDRRRFLAEKRIAELERWREETPLLGNVKSIDDLDQSWREPNVLEAIIFKKYNFWEISFLRYQKALYNLIDEIEKVSEHEPTFIVNKDRLRKTINVDREILYRIIQSTQDLSEDKKIYLLKLSLNMFDSIKRRLEFEMPKIDKVTYDLSQLEKRKYDIRIDKNSMQNYNQSNLHVVINDKNISFKDFQQEKDWLEGYDINLKENAQSNLSLFFPNPINLILETNWESVEDGNFATNSASLTISDFVNEKIGIVRNIANWNKMSHYIISFDYNTHGKGFKLLLFEKTTGKDQQISNMLIDELRSDKWKTYKSLIASSENTSSAFMQIIKLIDNDLLNRVESRSQITKIDIRNLSIIQIPNPKIILRRTNTANYEDKKIPQITFTRVNPTKYELKVQNATTPYTLVLVNQFNRKWKLIDPLQDTNNIKGFFSRFLGNIGMVVVGFEKKPPTINTQLTYFGDDIRENVRKDIFLNEKTFETWGKNAIAESKHFPVNGYANAWYIEPSDVGYKTDYNLIIEMNAQKHFYGNLLVSISTATFTLLIILLTLLKFLKK